MGGDGERVMVGRSGCYCIISKRGVLNFSFVFLCGSILQTEVL
jgi:hypothetical protein